MPAWLLSLKAPVIFVLFCFPRQSFSVWQSGTITPSPSHSLGLSFSSFCYDVCVWSWTSSFLLELSICTHVDSKGVVWLAWITLFPNYPSSLIHFHFWRQIQGERQERKTRGPAPCKHQWLLSWGPFSSTEVLRCRGSLSTVLKTACSFLSRTENRSYHRRAHTRHFGGSHWCRGRDNSFQSLTYGKPKQDWRMEDWVTGAYRIWQDSFNAMFSQKWKVLSDIINHWPSCYGREMPWEGLLPYCSVPVRVYTKMH